MTERTEKRNLPLGCLRIRENLLFPKMHGSLALGGIGNDLLESLQGKVSTLYRHKERDASTKHVGKEYAQACQIHKHLTSVPGHDSTKVADCCSRDIANGFGIVPSSVC